MPSPAAQKYRDLSVRADVLALSAKDRRLRPITADRKQLYLHGAIAVRVSAWNAYVIGLVRDFLQSTANPLDPKFHAMHTLCLQQAEIALKRFNTPNAENTRALLMNYTGYDPIGDWVWPACKMSGLDVRERLNEIIQVRHSFAHGFAIPSYSWNTNPAGVPRLTGQLIKFAAAFFDNLVKRTDNGMGAFIRGTYATPVPW